MGDGGAAAAAGDGGGGVGRHAGIVIDHAEGGDVALDRKSVV